MTASKQSQDVPSWLYLEAVIRNEHPDSAVIRYLHETNQCRIYSSGAEKMPETCRVLYQNKIGIINASGWLFKNKSITMNGYMNVKFQPSF